MDDDALASLIEILWPDGGAHGQQVSWLLDGARSPDIAGLVGASGLAHTCLFGGELHPRLAAAAPYLVQLPAGSPAAIKLLRQGWGQAWGIFTFAGADLTQARQRLHLKKFLRVQTEQGRKLAFRYYDPRVLNIFLPTCTDEEFSDFLGPIDKLIAESDDGAKAQEFGLRHGAMQRREHLLAGR